VEANYNIKIWMWFHLWRLIVTCNGWQRPRKNNLMKRYGGLDQVSGARSISGVLALPDCCGGMMPVLVKSLGYWWSHSQVPFQQLRANEIKRPFRPINEIISPPSQMLLRMILKLMFFNKLYFQPYYQTQNAYLAI
jgi:hypothetical protein